jgi:hypothetical protein
VQTDLREPLPAAFICIRPSASDATVISFCFTFGWLLNQKMHRLILFILIGLLASAQSQELSICSWNLKDFGSAKNETEIYFIANTVKGFDVVAIREVVASAVGEEAIIRLYEALENTRKIPVIVRTRMR